MPHYLVHASLTNIKVDGDSSNRPKAPVLRGNLLKSLAKPRHAQAPDLLAGERCLRACRFVAGPSRLRQAANPSPRRCGQGSQCPAFAWNALHSPTTADKCF
eukprot:6181995-Pleurochrysis_carterae.AAC.6